ncbi:MAG: HNH endonuclease [Anaerolineae bacterium]
MPATTEYFYKKSSARDGLQNRCKTCAQAVFKRFYDENADDMRERSRQYHADNPEKEKARKQRYKKENPDKVNEGTRRHYHKDPEKARARGRKYRVENPEKARDSVQRSREKHGRHEDPEKVKVRNRRYRIQNPEKVREIEKRSRIKNPEPQRAAARRRRAIEHQAPGEYTEAEILALYELQKGKCCWCGQPMGNRFVDRHLSRYENFTEDHIIPITRQGSNYIHNIVLACWRCNSSRQERLVFREWNPPAILEWMLDYIQNALTP